MSLTILALDTSTEACSVALLKDNQIIADFILSQREHTQRILPMVDKVLIEAEITVNALDAIAFGRGPGSFTGVRIGIGIAQGLAFGADKPLLAVSTLETLAERAYRESGATNVIATIDARMNEVYFGQYERTTDGNWLLLGKELVIKPEQVSHCILPFSNTKPVYSAGTGWQTYPDMMSNIQSTQALLPTAQDMLPIAKNLWLTKQWTAVENVEPTYLRNEVTWQKLPGRG
ncbi:tRNA (adenosine(37)-N6)-threonylcarbamoyltransferase complex dimerization subunit type 1 TsaB [Zophobihabitans entericus]|uniref:tRNA threonylcarbamoyladenosine biosynthesis protein TsaB n=1 Tax=Zophobihabitans entericus TaxID=1635327 RepID=A0A6G9IAF8_9GAMM|nr:tRNA (adenosine(37)-N6)-threonylcarbamoyltransferase complex dimerization subunit type 1 TsaB [Zophobihabitans entericus]QIQ21215.1 tRNA (adenosine(37)-N6)-threonylcarbamoyltransferase complex dimerization subunit type 1 TsaB [Zophobihabitans entericus]